MIVGVRSPEPCGSDRRGHHHDLGRLRIGLGQAALEHAQVVRRADRHQLAIGLGQVQRFHAELVGLLLVELLEVLVVLGRGAQAAAMRVLADPEHA